MFPVVILRREYKANCTRATLVLPSGASVRTIERPWLNNQQNVSCYPEGVYYVKWLPRSGSGKYKRVWHVQDVPNRSGILFHAGNLVQHSLGCTLPGLKDGTLGGLPAVLSSGTGLNKMRKELSGQDFILLVDSVR